MIRTELPRRSESDLVLIDRLEFLSRQYHGLGNPWPIYHIALTFDRLATAIEHQGRDGDREDSVLNNVLNEFQVSLTRIRYEEDRVCAWSPACAPFAAALRSLEADYRWQNGQYGRLFALAAWLMARGAWGAVLGGLGSVLIMHGLSSERRWPGEHRRGEHRASTEGNEHEPRGGYGPLQLDR